MAKLLGPDFLSLQVRDLAASRAFYTEVLKLTVDERFDTPEFVLFDTNSIPFGLAVARANLDEMPQPGLGVTFWLDCDHIDELHATLQEAGVNVVVPPANGPFGRSLTFLDPDGYRITANENPWGSFPLGGRKKL